TDTTPPVITCPAGITVPHDPGMAGAVVTFTVTARDDNLVSLTISPPSGSFFPIGTTRVTATATDSAGNTSTGSFSVTVTHAAPTVTVPDDAAAAEDVVLELNGISVGDADGDALTVTLTVGHGTLTLGTRDGLTSVNGDGSGSVMLSGSADALNAVLASLAYR